MHPFTVIDGCCIDESPSIGETFLIVLAAVIVGLALARRLYRPLPAAVPPAPGVSRPDAEGAPR